MLAAIKNRKRLVTRWRDRFEKWVLKQTSVKKKSIDEKQFVSSLTVLDGIINNPVVSSLDISSSKLYVEDLHDYVIEDVFDEAPWVADRILKSQLGLQKYAKFGGFEHYILHKFSERELYFLETFDDYYGVLKENSWTE